LNKGLLYLDSSALVKLVVREAETAALIAFAGGWPERVSSQLARVEVLRALRRAAASPSSRRRAEDILSRIALIRIDDAVIAAASDLDPADLRSLDAIHLATALSLGPELGAFVTYDRRLLEAADRARISAVAPS
jgi:predicted nucleic acid-binding protein